MVFSVDVPICLQFVPSYLSIYFISQVRRARSQQSGMKNFLSLSKGIPTISYSVWWVLHYLQVCLNVIPIFGTKDKLCTSMYVSLASTFLQICHIRQSSIIAFLYLASPLSGDSFIGQGSLDLEHFQSLSTGAMVKANVGVLGSPRFPVFNAHGEVDSTIELYSSFFHCIFICADRLKMSQWATLKGVESCVWSFRFRDTTVPSVVGLHRSIDSDDTIMIIQYCEFTHNT